MVRTGRAVASPIICKKVANALVAGVRPRPWLSWQLNWASLGAGSTVREGLEKRQGGLWVGGTLLVREGGVSFEPNLLNRAVQDGELAIELRWSDVIGVHVRPGFVTNIIELSHTDGTQAFRCFGARHVALEIDRAWKAATA